MIFVTVGSQKFQFNRLLKKIDELIEAKAINEDVFAQIGVSDYIPKNYKFETFIDRDEFKRLLDDCDIIITHGGTGSIINALKNGKKVIAAPRQVKYGEHVDNHQLQICRQFYQMKLIANCEDCSNLEKTLKYVKGTRFEKYCSNTDNVIDSIKEYLMDSLYI